MGKSKTVRFAGDSDASKPKHFSKTKHQKRHASTTPSDGSEESPTPDSLRSDSSLNTSSSCQDLETNDTPPKQPENDGKHSSPSVNSICKEKETEESQVCDRTHSDVSGTSGDNDKKESSGPVATSTPVQAERNSKTNTNQFENNTEGEENIQSTDCVEPTGVSSSTKLDKRLTKDDRTNQWFSRSCPNNDKSVEVRLYKLQEDSECNLLDCSFDDYPTNNYGFSGKISDSLFEQLHSPPLSFTDLDQPVTYTDNAADSNQAYCASDFKMELNYPDVHSSIPGPTSREQEKEELKNINDRLAKYIKEVQDMRQNTSNIDSSGFIKSINILENELVYLKNMYEKELEKTRETADDLRREKSSLTEAAQKNKNLVSELENKLAIEADRNQKAMEDVNMLQMQLMQRQRQQESMNYPDLQQLQRDNEALLRENEELRKRCEKAERDQQLADENAHHLKHQMEFGEEVNSQQNRDLSDRLQAASNTVLVLESKIRGLSQSDNSLAEMLACVREAAEAELKAYQQESAERYSKNLTEIKAQLDEKSDRVDELANENQQLNDQLGDLMTTIGSLEGQAGSEEHQKKCLEEQLHNERQRALEQNQHLEKKMRDLEDMLVVKMQETSAARDAQLPLKAEIEALKAMIEEEERRMMLLSERGDMTSFTSPGYPREAFTSPVTAVNKPGSPPAGSLRPNYKSQASPRVTMPHPLGPVRVRSAPASGERRRANLVPTSLGHGKDYFDEMFNDLKKRDTLTKTPDLVYTRTTEQPKLSPTLHYTKTPSPVPDSPLSYDPPETRVIPPEKPPSYVTHDYNTSTSSTIGDIRILEIHPDGKYIRLINLSETKDEELGDHFLRQNVGGHPVCVYRFPERVRFGTNSTVTVWSGSNDHKLHQPPTDFVFKEQQKWGTGPECTTILCKPSGQAIAWMTAAHRFSKDSFYTGPQETNNAFPASALLLRDGSYNNTDSVNDDLLDMRPEEELLEYDMNLNGLKQEPVCLRREKESPPSLCPQKHPHGSNPPTPVHPHTGQGRPHHYGNDNSSINRQSRIQSTRPDPLPGAPYAGASAQRMGSARLKKYQQPTIKGNGQLANASAGSIRYGQPSPFFSPKQQEYARAYDSRTTSLNKN